MPLRGWAANRRGQEKETRSQPGLNVLSWSLLALPPLPHRSVPPEKPLHKYHLRRPQNFLKFSRVQRFEHQCHCPVLARYLEFAERLAADHSNCGGQGLRLIAVDGCLFVLYLQNLQQPYPHPHCPDWQTAGDAILKLPVRSSPLSPYFFHFPAACGRKLLQRCASLGHQLPTPFPYTDLLLQCLPELVLPSPPLTNLELRG
mmetsp:Transcript_5977/g.9233  ORF Transcript_5977/g.9233 Transcript_5977/m.9233 type:complete len:202 (-) Transcript_5977:303-908(-)